MSMPIVIIERMANPDEHDALKCVRLLARVEGADPATYITHTIYKAQYADGGVAAVKQAVEKMRKDAMEYAGYGETKPALEAALKELGVKEI